MLVITKAQVINPTILTDQAIRTPLRILKVMAGATKSQITALLRMVRKNLTVIKVVKTVRTVKMVKMQTVLKVLLAKVTLMPVVWTRPSLPPSVLQDILPALVPVP
jgi:hypothetical protein